MRYIYVYELRCRFFAHVGLCLIFQIIFLTQYGKYEAGRGAAARGVTAKPTGCGFDPHSRRWNIYLNLYFHFFALMSRLSAALSSATQHAMPPEFGRKWGTECLNTRFPLPTLLCAGNSVKLIKKKSTVSWIHISLFDQQYLKQEQSR